MKLYELCNGDTFCTIDESGKRTSRNYKVITWDNGEGTNESVSLIVESADQPSMIGTAKIDVIENADCNVRIIK